MIFTLNARDNFYFDVMKEHLNLSHQEIYKEINVLFSLMVKTLEKKKISYPELKNVLIPRRKRQEAGFIFDSNQIESSLYGREIFSKVLPLFEKDSRHSILAGDLLGEDQVLIKHILNESLVTTRPLNFVHSSSLFCIYLNNLTENALQQINKKLSGIPYYIGYVPAKYDSVGKTYLSTTLRNECIKFKNTIILMHEDDRSNDENIDNTLWGFEKFGFEIQSIQTLYFDLFLAYKIERAVSPEFGLDTEISINSISTNILKLENFQIEIEQKKMDYLQTAKKDSLKKAGILSLTGNQLSELIKEKVASSYIYNMTFVEEHSVMKFNLMIEIKHCEATEPTKLLAALEYKPQVSLLRLLTLY